MKDIFQLSIFDEVKRQTKGIMNVLVACEESQRVCTEFRKRGHNAFSCDIQECSGSHPEWHIQGDCLPLLNGYCWFICQDGEFHNIPGKWDLIIAHPPCTYLSNAGARWLFSGGKLNEKRYQKGLAGKEFFMKFFNADCDRIVIENPVPSSIYNLPQYTQTIQPYQFGHPYTKKTCLWIKGNISKLMPTEVVEPIKGRRFQQKNGKWRNSCWEMDQKGKRAKERSKTFEGIAKAMAEQWG